MNRNRIRICGRNTSTLPTPEITPFWTKLCSSPSGSASCASTPSHSKPAAIKSISGFAQANTAWNMTNSRHSRMSRPATGCSSTASTRPVTVSGRDGCADRGLDDAVGLALRGAQVRRGRRLPGAFDRAGPRRTRRHLVHAPQQFLGAAAPHRGRGDHRHAKLGRQLIEIDVDAAPARDVDHVEHEQHRPADPLQLDDEAERDAQVGGIRDAQQQIRRAPRWPSVRARRRG